MLGRIPGTPDELTYYKDILRYFDALDKASARVTLFRIGKSEEGRDMIVVVVADEATIKTLDKYKEITREADRSADARPRRRPGSSSPPASRSTGRRATCTRGETGSAEMLMELAYRLAVEETPVHPEHPRTT